MSPDPALASLCSRLLGRPDWTEGEVLGFVRRLRRGDVDQLCLLLREKALAPPKRVT